MSKKHIIIIISLVVVLGLLIGAYFVVSKLAPPAENKDGQSTVPQVISILKVPKDDIVEINKKTGTFNYTLVKGEIWTVAGSDTIKLNQSSVESLAYEVSSITASELISENETNLDPYGLSAPYGTVTVKLNSGETHALNIGNKTPMQNSYYVNTSDTPSSVYIIYSSTADSLLADVDKLRDKTILEIKDDEIAFFRLTRKEGSNIYIKKKSKEIVESQAMNNTVGMFMYDWDMLEPYKLEAGNESLNDILFKLSSLTIKDFITNNSNNLAEYGLTNPSYTIEYGNNEGKSVKLMIGKSQEGYSYAQIYPNSTVITLDNSNITFKDINPLYLVNRLAHLVNIESVAKVAVAYQDEQYALKIQKSGDDYSFEINEKSASVSKSKAVYQDMIGLLIEDIVTQQITAAPEIKIEYTYNDGKIDTILLMPSTERYYAMSINGKTEYLIEKKSAMLMLEHIRELNQNPQ